MRAIAYGVVLLLALPIAAQEFSPLDTVTEYPHKGTYYHDRFEGRKTASGEVFDQNKFTAAHWKLKLGTMVLVTNRNSGKQVIVKVNDRCPKRGVFDLSRRAAAAIGIKGSQPVAVRVLPAGYERKWAAQENLFDSVGPMPSKKRPAKAKEDKKPAAAGPQTSEPTAAPPVPALAQALAVADEKQAPAKTGGEVRCCNIVLGAAPTHAEAYETIHKLPEPYQGKVAVEPVIGGTGLLLTLEVNLPRSKAKSLAKALRHAFPESKMTCCE